MRGARREHADRAGGPGGGSWGSACEGRRSGFHRYGREAYFWGLIAALGVFVAGAAFSVREGIAELIHPGVTSSFGVAYVVLAISAVFDLVSFRRPAGQMMGRARRHNRDLLGESRATSDPTLRAVFAEDMVSGSGDLITLAALGLNQVTGSSIPQGVAAVVIGLMLIRSSLRLGRRSHDFLLGAWLVTPATSGGRRRAARIGIDDHLSGAQVKSLIRNLESDLKHEPEGIYRVDVVPVENDAP